MDLRKALAAAPLAQAGWEDITPMARRDWISVGWPAWVAFVAFARHQLLGAAALGRGEVYFPRLARWFGHEGNPFPVNVTFPDGSRWEWVLDGQTIHAQQPLLLRFRVFDKDGKPASDLEPYMGMSGHLVLVKRDLSVFAHVHPAGSVPMAALMLLENQTSDGGQAAHAMPGMHGTPVPAEIKFPYGFPQPGGYRLFVQIKRNGQVETGVFDARVEP